MELLLYYNFIFKKKVINKLPLFSIHDDFLPSKVQAQYTSITRDLSPTNLVASIALFETLLNQHTLAVVREVATTTKLRRRRRGPISPLANTGEPENPAFHYDVRGRITRRRAVATFLQNFYLFHNRNWFYDLEEEDNDLGKGLLFYNRWGKGGYIRVHFSHFPLNPPIYGRGDRGSLVDHFSLLLHYDKLPISDGRVPKFFQLLSILLLTGIQFNKVSITQYKISNAPPSSQGSI